MIADAHPELTPVGGGVVLSVHAQPGARRTEVVGRQGEAVKIRVAAPAVEGRANEALIAFVADEFGLRKSAVTVRSGGSSRHKRLRLDGIDPTAAAQVVDRLVRPS